jgi:hypothetical protein
VLLNQQLTVSIQDFTTSSFFIASIILAWFPKRPVHVAIRTFPFSGKAVVIEIDPSSVSMDGSCLHPDIIPKMNVKPVKVIEAKLIRREIKFIRINRWSYSG